MTRALGDHVSCWNATSAGCPGIPVGWRRGSPLTSDRTWFQRARQRAQAAIPSQSPLLGRPGSRSVAFEKSFHFQASCLSSPAPGMGTPPAGRRAACSRSPSRGAGSARRSWSPRSGTHSPLAQLSCSRPAPPGPDCPFLSPGTPALPTEGSSVRPQEGSHRSSRPRHPTPIWGRDGWRGSGPSYSKRSTCIASSAHLLELSLSSQPPEPLDQTLHLQALRFGKAHSSIFCLGVSSRMCGLGLMGHLLQWGLGSESSIPQEAQGSCPLRTACSK